MIFQRRILARTWSDYTRYRPFLRRDFQNRCAYCLRHEFFLGGEAGCEIDHHRPLRGPFARPDLESVYENLYWSCAECNQNKGDAWPTAKEWDSGRRFLDPCQADGDHDLHWRTDDNGKIVALTQTGEYTIETLLLWREQLTYLRRQQARWQRELTDLERLTDERALTDDERVAIQIRLTELRDWISPPVFDRPR